MPTADSRPWWSFTKAEQKQQIEDALEWYLSQDAPLTDRQMLLLRDAIARTYRGLFGVAIQDIYDLALTESAWSPTERIEPAMLEGVTLASLRRALAALRASAVQERPVFR